MLKRDLKNKISTESNDTESVDIRDLEELSAAIESDVVVVDEATAVLTTVENQVEVLNENIDTMSPMEIGRAIGAIETNLDRVSNDTNTIDTESISTVKRDLEAISDSIKKAWEAVKQFFRAVWRKLKEWIRKIMAWFRVGKKEAIKKTEDIIDTIDLTKPKSDITTSIVREKLKGVYASIIGERGNVSNISRVPSLLEAFNVDVFRKGYNDQLSELVHKTVLNNIRDNFIKVIKVTDDSIVYARFESAKVNHVYKGIETHKLESKGYHAAMDSLTEMLMNPDEVKRVIEYAKSIFDYKTTYEEYLSKELDRVDKLLDGEPYNLKYTDIPEPYTRIIWNDSPTATSWVGLKDRMPPAIIVYELQNYSKFLFAELKGLCDTEYYMYTSYDNLLNTIKEIYESK